MSNKLIHMEDHEGKKKSKNHKTTKPKKNNKKNASKFTSVSGKTTNVDASDAQVKGKPAKESTENGIGTEGKILTKYDQKIQRRKQEQIKAARRRKISIIASIVIIASLIVGGLTAAWINYDKVHHEYIAIDNDPISEIEFDFYYALYKQNLFSQTLYGTMTYETYFTSYMGYDSSKADKYQTYSSVDDETWYDYFAQGTLDSIKEYRALLQAADDNGFSYDTLEDDYNTYAEQIASAAESAGQSVDEFYKDNFGTHATEDNLKEYIDEYLKAAAYQYQLQTDLAPTSDEIAAYYEEKKDSYDSVNYRSFTFTADSASDTTSMATAKLNADTMAAAVTDESSFIELCKKNATADEESTYADDAGSLTTDAYLSTLDDSIGEWLFSADRVAGDVTVIEDTDDGEYTVLYFVSRTPYDATSDSTLASTLLSNKYSDFIAAYTDNMTVNDKHNRIKLS